MHSFGLTIRLSVLLLEGPKRPKRGQGGGVLLSFVGLVGFDLTTSSLRLQCHGGAGHFHYYSSLEKAMDKLGSATKTPFPRVRQYFSIFHLWLSTTLLHNFWLFSNGYFPIDTVSLRSSSLGLEPLSLYQHLKFRGFNYWDIKA